MKTTTHPKLISPSLALFGMAGLIVLYLWLSETKLPLLSDPAFALATLVVIGMAMCAQGGIGRVAALQEWAHPLSLVAYILGVMLLFIMTATFLGRPLPFIQTIDQAILAVAVLSGLKVVLTYVHNHLT